MHPWALGLLPAVGCCERHYCDMGACVPARVSAFGFWGHARSGIAGSYSNSAFSCSKCFRTVFHSGCANFIPMNRAQALDFSAPSPAQVVFCFLDSSHPHGCERVSTHVSLMISSVGSWFCSHIICPVLLLVPRRCSLLPCAPWHEQTMMLPLILPLMGISWFLIQRDCRGCH